MTAPPYPLTFEFLPIYVLDEYKLSAMPLTSSPASPVRERFIEVRELVVEVNTILVTKNAGF